MDAISQPSPATTASPPTINEERILAAIFCAVISEHPGSLRLLSSLPEESHGAPLVHWLTGHGLAETVLAGLSEIHALADFPAAEILRQNVQRRAARHLAQTAALEELGTVFHANGINAAATGAHGAIRQIYPYAATRTGSDIDLVFVENDLARARTLLHEIGFDDGVHPELLTRDAVTLDLAQRPSDLIRFTNRAEEALGFPGLDDAWATHLEPGAVTGIQQFSLPFEGLLSALHYAYKHRFSRHGWGLDMILIARALSPTELLTLGDHARRTGADVYFLHIARHLTRLATCPALPQLSGIAPSHDERWIRAGLLRRFSRGATSADQGYLLALAQCEDNHFRYQLLRQLILPNTSPQRRDRLADGTLPTTVSTRARLRQLAALPRRALHAILSGR